MQSMYEINSSTLAIIAVDKNVSKILEEGREFYIEKPAFEILNDSCRFFGSSYAGRCEGTKYLMGISYKSPIIVEESKNMIFFPTTSPRSLNCSWIALNQIYTYKNIFDRASIRFNNGCTINLNISYNIIENQILRATKLDALLRKRKNGNEKICEVFNSNFNF